MKSINSIQKPINYTLQGLKLSKQHLVDSYLKVPLGLLVMLGILYGVNQIIILTGINFPSSVTCMLLLYFILLISSKVIGTKKTSVVISYIEIPAGFSLRWINIFFTPAFVTLPLSSWISAREALTIAAVFLFGYLITTALIAYFCIFLQKLFNLSKHSEEDDGQDLPGGDEQEREGLVKDEEEEEYLERIETVPEIILDELPRGDENSIELELLQPIYNSKDPNIITAIETTGSNRLVCTRSMLSQTSTPQEETNFITKNIDYIILAILFIVSLPIYFVLDYSMPLTLSISITMFLIMLRLPPPKLKKFLHPVLCSVCLSLLFFYIFSLMKHENFLHMLRQYKTGRTYLELFNNHKHTSLKPGTGDVFSSLMDCSIVSLSLPMYTYRNDLKRHFFILLPAILLMSFGSFFIYPILCYHIGISPERSLGFAGRSVTLALGTPFIEALGGSIPLMACTTVVSGIFGALTGETFFKWLLIKKNDYVTRGITLGVNCGAIATAHLLTIDPRAAAMSSLSFVLFGTVMVILGSVSALADILRGLVGL